MPEDHNKSRDKFQDFIFREISYRDKDINGNIIRGQKVNFKGSAKIEVEEESLDGVKIVLKKDAEENIKEIKFICSCGQTKTVMLDYDDE